MRLLSACLTLLVAAGLVAAQKDKTQKPDKPEVKWEKYTPKGANAEVSFPGKATAKADKGSGNLVLSKGKDAVYLMSYNDFPKAIDITDKAAVKKILDNGRDGGLKSLMGKLLSEKDITLDKKYPGRAFDMESKTFGIYRTRIYLSKNRLYQVVVLGPKEFVDS